jgi:hypothetical protein
MAFKPSNSNQQSTPVNPNIPKLNWNELNKGVKGGSRPARVSLIVDLGTQEREPSTKDYNPNDPKQAEALTKGSYVENINGKDILHTPRKPVQQVAVLADLLNDVVDYGGQIGKQPYRVLLNPSFKGDIKGVDLAGCYSYDESGKRLEEKPFTFHAQSLLTKLAKATKTLSIIDGGADNMDVSLLAGKAFMAQIAVNTSGENTYVNYKGCSEVPLIEDEDGNEAPLKVKPLTNEARIITFDSVTEDDVKFLRGDLVKKIKQALNYHGSKMQAVLENNRANTQNNASSEPSEPAKAQGNAKPQAKAKEAPKASEAIVDAGIDLDDQIPF